MNNSCYFEIVELQASQQDFEIIFILKVPFVKPENYIMFKSFPITVVDERTVLIYYLNKSTI